MEYKLKDFEGMAFNVMNVPENVPVMEVFPQLKLHKEFTKEVMFPKDLGIRLICLLYDPKSPLNGITDFGQRKGVAMRILGVLPNEDDQYPEMIVEMISGKEQDFNQMIVAFLRILRSPVWANLKLIEKMYWSIIERAMEGDTQVDPKKIETYSDALEKATQKFLSGDNGFDIMRAVYTEVLKEDLDLSPEAVAAKLRDGEPVFPD